MRIIAFYLPQFHAIPENDAWWGKGFTEWVNVRGAKPLFPGHYQPRVPLGGNYYCLLERDTLEWQIGLAKEYGVYGFCIYHYWFGGHKLLEKPLEMLRDDSGLNIPYCICWANENWTNAWVANKKVQTLIKQTYGDRTDWEQHFDYLLSFFRDPNYIREDGKPLLVVYRPELIDRLDEMLDYWNARAMENGFPGIAYAYQSQTFMAREDSDDSSFAYGIEYQPGRARILLEQQKSSPLQKGADACIDLARKVLLRVDRRFNTNLLLRASKARLQFEEYDELCRTIVEARPKDDKAVAGMFVGWDNTPRRQFRGRVCLHSTPEKFEYYLSRQIENAKKHYKSDLLFLFAWNEWAEGGYLEPDEKYRFGYLEAIRSALGKNGP